MGTIDTTIRLQEAEKMRKRYIERAEEKISEYMKNAQKDFCSFFHWNAKDMYYSTMIREYFTDMPKITELDDVELLKKSIRNRIERIESELLNTSSFGSCTDEIVNLEHRLKLESKRIIRNRLLDITYIFE